ncbi:hypothetical protein NE463_19830, partial [Anaerotruncus colihominis]|nr:hypothetical protein [Anaerotruncus colihominis]
DEQDWSRTITRIQASASRHPTGWRFTNPAASRAEARYQKAAADYHFHTAAQEHPELSKNYITRYWQKQRLRRQYQKRAKEAAKQSAKAARKTAAATENLTARAAGFV